MPDTRNAEAPIIIGDIAYQAATGRTWVDGYHEMTPTERIAAEWFQLRIELEDESGWSAWEAIQWFKDQANRVTAQP